MPLVNKTFGEIITFTRASTGSYFDATGTLQSAAINSPRFDYNPTTLAPQGFLIEEARTNSIRNNTMVGAVVGGALPTNWTFSTTGATTTQVVGTGTENGITYIDIRFQGTGAADTWNIIYDTSVVAANGQSWTSAVYLKLAAGSAANLALVQRLVFRNSSFVNIQALDSSAITPTGAGLATQRSTLSLTATQATTAFVTNQLNSGTPTGAYDITLRIGLPQLEQGAFATSVIPTAPVFVSRASTGTYFDSAGVLQSAAINVARNNYNPASLSSPPILLLEAAATNSLTYSEDLTQTAWVKSATTVTSNAVVSPSGTLTADVLIADTATSEHTCDQAFSAVAGTTYTVSAFVKANGLTDIGLRFTVASLWTGSLSPQVRFDLSSATASTISGTPSASSITFVGNGWYRVSMSVVCATNGAPGARLQLMSGSANIFAGNGIDGVTIWGAQLEAGDFPTSYIPTTTTALTRSADVFTQAAVTRSADLASVNTLSPWFNASAGTLFAEMQRSASASNNASITAISDGTVDNRLQLRVDSASTNTNFIVLSAAVNYTYVGAFGSGSINKTVLAYETNNVNSAANGLTGTTDTNETIPTGLSKLDLGQVTNAAFLNGYLRRITYYPRRLSDAEIRSLTLPTGAVISTQDYTLDTNFTGNTVAIGS